jgi:hypothetical protein
VIDTALKLCVCVCTGNPLSVTITVNEYVLAAVGVPLITPVDEFKLNPDGSEPLTILHV